MKLFSRQFFFSIAYVCLLLQTTCQRLCPVPPLPEERLWIGHINNARDYLQECGCALQLPSDEKYNSGRAIFAGDTSGRALMNISGRDTELYVSYSTEPLDRRLQKGDRFNVNYTAERTTVKINFEVTDSCPETEKNCRISYVKANLVVTRVTAASKTLERKYSAVGACGCP
jgi:hypothetical protein